MEETPMSTITIDKSRPFLHEYGLENFGLHISKSSSIGKLFIIVKLKSSANFGHIGSVFITACPLQQW